MKQRKLNYIIHNPNREEETINVLLKVLVQANEKKIERKFQKKIRNNANVFNLGDSSFKM